jgi:hypothetical protein
MKATLRLDLDAGRGVVPDEAPAEGWDVVLNEAPVWAAAAPVVGVADVEAAEGDSAPSRKKEFPALGNSLIFWFSFYTTAPATPDLRRPS